MKLFACIKLPTQRDCWLGSEHYSPSDLAGASIAANTQKSFFSNHPQESKLYQSCYPEPQSPPRNFIYVPLLKDQETIAILEFKNNLLGDITPKELAVIKASSKILCQFLSEYYANQKMLSSYKTTTGLENYLSANIVTQIKKKEAKMDDTQGVEKNIVILFAKINNFSEMTEKISAASIIDLLNYHYEHMEKIIIKHHGTIDKIMGNVIMAVWGHIEEQHDPLEVAIDAAIEMQRTANSLILKIWQERGISNYGLGIGINQGKAVAGNLGAKQFLDFTVIGDTINMAQRLEDKASNGEIWLTSEVVSLDHSLKIKPNKKINGVKVKGKEFPFSVAIFTPLED